MSFNRVMNNMHEYKKNASRKLKQSQTDENANLIDINQEEFILIPKTFQTVPCCSPVSGTCEIYCYGPVLEAAQNAHIYNDSKSFVDMKMVNDSDVILHDYDELQNQTGGSPNSSEVSKFVGSHFEAPGSEFENWSPPDWKESPKFLDGISDGNLRRWASDLNKIWKELGRKIIADVGQNNDHYSMIYSSNPIIIPGGRFREFYYWDCYWIIKGLLISEMYTTVKGAIRNFLDMVNKFGFVPNGGRLYYTRRSQPPFLTLMVKEYVDKTGDKEFLTEVLPTLDKEYKFWMANRSVVVKDANEKEHTLNRYASDVNQPRPESYREDAELISGMSEDVGREIMTHVTSACESGWDFSSRWAGSRWNSNTDDMLTKLRTRDIVPVDLNSILAAVEKTLYEFHTDTGNQIKATEYQRAHEERTEAIEKLLWNDEDGVYYDLLIQEKEHNRRFFMSNLNPLWTKCYHSSVDVTKREKRLYDYLKETSVLTYPGGIPTSLTDSGQQWDFPNAWPPLVHMLIDGMASSEVEEIRQEAYKQAQKWVLSNYRGYTNPKYDYAMFEKYDVTRVDGLPGGGGEYEVQKGFGWTNGVVLTLLEMYGDRLLSESSTQAMTTSTSPEMTTSSACRNLLSGALAVTATVAALGSLSG